MFHPRISMKRAVRVERLPGIAGEIDSIPAGHAFLRAAWYGDEGGAASTLLLRRGGMPVAALPTVPALPGVCQVPGSYWPFRGLPIAPDIGEDELALLLAAPGLGAAWRLGPVYDQGEAALLTGAAAKAGWTVLKRPLGTAFLLDLAALSAGGGWPRASTLKRCRNYERQLGALGAVEWRSVSGDAWSERVLETLGRIEANSWIAARTDGSGAKFLGEAQRAHWRRVLADPVLARMLSASLLVVGGTPAAFSFDLTDGKRRYAIAGTHDERFARYRPGKLLLLRELAQAAGQGIEQIDLGAGDSGYKTELGAAAGPQIVDLLFVRPRALAFLLRRRWERPGQAKAAS